MNAPLVLSFGGKRMHLHGKVNNETGVYSLGLTPTERPLLDQQDIDTYPSDHPTAVLVFEDHEAIRTVRQMMDRFLENVTLSKWHTVYVRMLDLKTATAPATDLQEVPLPRELNAGELARITYKFECWKNRPMGSGDPLSREFCEDLYHLLRELQTRRVDEG